MVVNLCKWASRHRKIAKSGHGVAAETIPFRRRWHGCMISVNLEAIWGMSDKGYKSAEEYRAARDAIIPSGRMGTGFDVAYASLFLASDEATHITGTHLVVDGGVTATAPGV